MEELLTGIEYLDFDEQGYTFIDTDITALDLTADTFAQYEDTYLPPDFFESIDVEAEGLLSTFNAELEGEVHPETGVSYEVNKVLTDEGLWKKGVFPVFDAEFDAHLPIDQYQASPYYHQQIANEQLQFAYETDASRFSHFGEDQIEQIIDGETPEGYVWHHHEEMGRMQLVESNMHDPSGHTGGMSIWGGGYS
ncbi:HNH endonuclease [Salipaludibacillus aurantiacus]|uniref:DNase/tRNase domain of colicin-like bacteriocin n=1 Tax=Salipaludibacillus aurantiacus TaxID=1601833 RepID=A0A1H9UFE7_9BACI|nr:HNH endonuclease [Salipaludibacillus aurantiacus]SES08092.1 DNase/tRNase domain of colicin-like bacteriocin [Salipaludibacillus aurantiacus]